jgi:hypothetical protein
MTLGADIATTRHTVEAAGQGHVLRNWDSLSDYQQSALLRDIQVSRNGATYVGINMFHEACTDFIAEIGESGMMRWGTLLDKTFF